MTGEAKMKDFNWIIEVIGDIQDFAESNGLPEISEKVSRAKSVAINEIQKRSQEARVADTSHTQ